MRYSEGKLARTFVLRFGNGEDVLKSMKRFVLEKDVRGGIVWLVGALSAGRAVTGPQELEMPPKPQWTEFADGREMLGIGTIFWENGEPSIHLHGSFGRGRETITGCLREVSEAFLIVEAVVLEVTGTGAERRLDEESQMSLLDV